MVFSRLLLIEDNTGTRKRFVDILSKRYTVIDVSTIDRAVNQLRKHNSGDEHFDLIVLDLNINCNTLYLTKEEQTRAVNSMLAGWIWVHKMLLSDDNYSVNGIPIMILSSYVSDLEGYLLSDDNASEKEVFDRYVEQGKLKCFDKWNVGEKCQLLLEFIKAW